MTLSVPSPEAGVELKTAASRQSLSLKRQEAIWGYLFIAPDAIGLLIFVGLPMVLSIALGLYEVDGFGGYRFVGFGNFIQMWNDARFWHCVRVTLVYVSILVPMLYASGLALALLVERTTRVTTVLRAMLFLPQMISLVVIAMAFQFLTADKVGPIARLLSGLGVGGLSLLGDPRFALYTVIAVSVWFLMGFYMLIFLGGLNDIPRELHEAAKIDGAGRASRFWNITLPMLRPTSFFVILTAMVAAITGSAAFDLVFVMTKGGPANSTSFLIHYIYQQAFQYNAFGYASAMSSVLVAILLGSTLLLYRLTSGGRFGVA